MREIAQLSPIDLPGVNRKLLSPLLVFILICKDKMTNRADQASNNQEGQKPLNPKEEKICVAIGLVFFICIVVSNNAASSILNGSHNVIKYCIASLSELSSYFLQISESCAPNSGVTAGLVWYTNGVFLALSGVAIVSFLELKGKLAGCAMFFAYFARIVLRMFEITALTLLCILSLFGGGSGSGGGSCCGGCCTNCCWCDYKMEPRQFADAIFVQAAHMGVVAIIIDKVFVDAKACFPRMIYFHMVPPIILAIACVVYLFKLWCSNDPTESNDGKNATKVSNDKVVTNV
jgi:hypothetical protein